MSRFDLNKMGKKIEETKVELGKSYMNEESLKLRDTRKKTEYIPLDQIIPNPDNRLSMERVPWLMQDIKMNGLLQPLVVVQMDDGKYMLYAGHQRFEAIKRLHKDGNFGDTVEVKVQDLDALKLPKEVSLSVRKKLLLRSANIQRGNGYATDADRYVVINDWKEIYAELRRCGVEFLEYGLEDSEDESREQIKGVKTRELVSKKVGLSPAQVEKFDRVENHGADELKDALKEDKIPVVIAAEVASKPKQEQEKILEKIKETKEISSDNKITRDDIMLAEQSINKSVTSASKEPSQSDTLQGHHLTKKTVNADLKKVFKIIREAGEDGLPLDDTEYFAYLKHVSAIEKIVQKVAEK